MNLEWTAVEHGEYNEQYTYYKDTKITIFSDRNEEYWSYYLDENDDDAWNNYSDREEAIQEAIAEIDLEQSK